MKLRKFFILAQTQDAADALALWRNQLAGMLEKVLVERSQVIVNSDTLDLTRINHVFAELNACIEIASEQARLSGGILVVMVDEVSPRALSVIAESGWNALIATLILTFPEVKWVFGCAPSSLSVDNQTPDALSWFSVFARCSLPSLLEADDGCPHFDGSGLRTWVRQCTNEGLRDEGMQLGIRSKICAAIDDEESYAHFHAYTAYRFGLRSEAISTWKLMKLRFNKKEDKDKEDKEPHGYWMLLEDMSLNFPDRKAGDHVHRLGLLPGEKEQKTREDHLSKLKSIQEATPILENSEYRVLVTSGQSRSGSFTHSKNSNGSSDNLEKNEEYLKLKGAFKNSTSSRKWESSDLIKTFIDLVFCFRGNDKSKVLETSLTRYGVGVGKKVAKPAAGMFALLSDIFKDSGMFEGKDYIPGFVPLGGDGNASTTSGRHGAPGRVGLIANKLIRRAAKINERVLSVEEAVLGAVLATDALELTGCRSPTTAFDALSLKHQLEVIAECQFSGVEYNFELEQRLKIIKNDIGFIFKLTNGKKPVYDNAEMSLLMHLVRIFRAYAQFDEEQQCMLKVRKLHNSLWISRQSPCLGPLYAIPLRYIWFLLSSPFKFAGCILFWLLILGGLFMASVPEPNIWCGLQDSFSSFFSIGPPLRADESCCKVTNVSWFHAVVGSLTMFMGALHLGVFISYLYSLIARK